MLMLLVMYSGDYYLRLLLEEDESNEEYSAIKKSSVFVFVFFLCLQFTYFFAYGVLLQ